MLLLGVANRSEFTSDHSVLLAVINSVVSIEENMFWSCAAYPCDCILTHVISLNPQRIKCLML